MKEFELTGRNTSSKLNIAQELNRGRFVMDKSLPEYSLRKPDALSNLPGKEESKGDILGLGQLLAEASPQGAREVARALVEAARVEGRSLTQDQKDFVRGTGYIPAMAGGSDDPINEGFNPESTPISEQVTIRTDDITDTKLRNALERLQLKYNNPNLTEILDPQEDLNDLYRLEGVDPRQLEIAMGRVGDILARVRAREQIAKDAQKYRDFHTFVLQYKDMRELDADSFGWLNNQFNILYAIAEQGAELDSPQLRALENKFNDAVSFLVTQGKSSKEVRDFQIRFNVMTGLLIGRAQIDRRSLEGIQGSAARLGATGLLTGFSFDEGRVGAMFNRMAELAEDTRIREGGFERDPETGKIKSELQHLSSEMINKLQQSLEDEQYSLALKGVGVFANLYKDFLTRLGEEGAKNALRADIRRTVRTAYGAFGISQRQAVIAARGRQYTQFPYDFFTDPKSIFDMFNVEELLTGKWKSLNNEQQKFFKLIKLDLAKHSTEGKDVSGMSEDELLELGTRLFRDLFVVPDFFSSSWRIKGTLDKINDLQLYYAQNEEIVNDLKNDGARYLLGDEENVLQIRAKLAELKDYISEKQRETVEARIREGNQLTDEEQENIHRNIRDQAYMDFVARGVQFEGKILVLDFRERSFFTTRFSEQTRINNNKRARQLSQNLALFMRLKSPEKDEDGKELETKNQIWARVQKFRAEEIIRIVRERSGKLGKFGEIDKIDQIFINAGVSTDIIINARGERVSIRAYDKFKKEYGPVLSSIREKALRSAPPQPVDFRHMTDEQKKEIDNALGRNGAWQVVERAYNGMDRYIQNNKIINKFLHSTDYEDIYNRVVTVDDTIMDQLETPPENSGLRDGELTGYWASERGGDALVRNYNDLAAAQKATGELVNFLRAEGQENYKKHAEEFAHNVMNYNGVSGAAKCFRYTYGSYLMIARQDYMWDLIGIGKAPLRIATSEIERIFGPSADPLTREFLLKELDRISSILSTENPDHVKAAKYYNELMVLLGTDVISRIRDKSLQSFFFITLLLMLAPVASSMLAVKEASK